MSGAIKRDFRTYIRQYTSPNENFEYGYPHSNALLQFRPELEPSKPHKAACHPTRCDVINDVKLFPTVNRRIYCRKFLTLSNQTSRYKSSALEYLMMCKVYTDVGGIKYLYFVCPPVHKIIHSLKLMDYLHIHADNPWYNYYFTSTLVLLTKCFCLVSFANCIPFITLKNRRHCVVVLEQDTFILA